MYATIGNTVQIACTAKTRILATKWRKDNKAFIDDSTVISGRFTVKNFNDTSNVLQISNITEDDFGVYQCKLQRKKGVSTQNICLKAFVSTTPISSDGQKQDTSITNYIELDPTPTSVGSVEQTGWNVSMIGDRHEMEPLIFYFQNWDNMLYYEMLTVLMCELGNGFAAAMERRRIAEKKNRKHRIAVLLGCQAGFIMAPFTLSWVKYV